MIENGKKKLGGNIEFFVNFPREKIPSLFHAADVLMHGALHEMLGIALLEALASGVPVIAHNTRTLSWVIGQSGELIDAMQATTGSQALQRYLDPSYQKNKSVLARRQAVSIFSKEIILEQLIAMYREVLNHA